MNKECRACSEDRICNPATGRCVLKTGEIGRKLAREPLSAEDDPYSLKLYPLKYQIVIGKQAHNARQLIKAAQAKGAYLNMYRQPLTPAQIERLKVLVPHELAHRNNSEATGGGGGAVLAWTGAQIAQLRNSELDHLARESWVLQEHPTGMRRVAAAQVVQAARRVLNARTRVANIRNAGPFALEGEFSAAEAAQFRTERGLENSWERLRQQVRP